MQLGSVLTRLVFASGLSALVALAVETAKAQARSRFVIAVCLVVVAVSLVAWWGAVLGFRYTEVDVGPVPPTTQSPGTYTLVGECGPPAIGVEQWGPYTGRPAALSASRFGHHAQRRNASAGPSAPDHLPMVPGPRLAFVATDGDLIDLHRGARSRSPAANHEAAKCRAAHAEQAHRLLIIRGVVLVARPTLGPMSTSGEPRMLAIRVIPRAKHDEVGGEHDGRLVVRTTAAPVDDQANVAVRKLVARHLQVAARQVQIVAGHRSRDKVLRIGR